MKFKGLISVAAGLLFAALVFRMTVDQLEFFLLSLGVIKLYDIEDSINKKNQQ